MTDHPHHYIFDPSGTGSETLRGVCVHCGAITERPRWLVRTTDSRARDARSQGGQHRYHQRDIALAPREFGVT